MSQVLLLLGEILVQLGKQIAIGLGVTTILNAINNLLAGNSGASSYLQLTNEVGTTLSEVENGTYGLSALAALIAAARTDILTAVGTPQQAGSAVTLPSTPPAGYGGLDAGATGDAVWGYTLASTPFSETAGQALSRADSFAYNVGENVNLTYNFAPYFTLETAWDGLSGISILDYPQPDIRNVLPGDTALSFLNREAPAYTWSYQLAWGGAVKADALTFGGVWVFQLNDADINFIANGGNSSATTRPPVWPGLANVTLGTPVAIDVGVTIAESMHGVIIAITSVPSKQGQFNFDTATSWRNIGALSFFDDNGEQEFPQTLGFTDCVYCPQTMSVASGVRLRSSAGVAGTITPWSIV